MKKTIKPLLIICCLSLALAFGLTGCKTDGCKAHTYDNACDATCNECGEERTVTHDWKPATCTTYEVCENCEAVKGGDLLEHNYTATGYDDHYHYQKCSVCGAPDEESKIKHVLDDEYTCECGVHYTVEAFSGGMDGYSTTVISLYNSNENLVKKIEYANEELYRTIDFYYENGYLIKEEIYLADGTLEYYILYEYDEDGNETKFEWYLGDGTPDGVNLFEYNDNGDVIKETYTDTDGYGFVHEYEYDENDNLIKKTYTDTDGYGFVHEYVYDENDNLIKETYTDTDGYGFVYEYEYDENGNLIKETHIDSEGNETVTEY